MHTQSHFFATIYELDATQILTLLPKEAASSLCSDTVSETRLTFQFYYLPRTLDFGTECQLHTIGWYRRFSFTCAHPSSFVYFLSVISLSN